MSHSPVARSGNRLSRLRTPGSPGQCKLSSLSTIVASLEPAPKKGNFAKAATAEMDVRTKQVKVSVIESHLGGRDMSNQEARGLKDFQKLAVLTSSKNVRKLEKTSYNTICQAGNSVAAIAAKASKRAQLVVKTVANIPETAETDMKTDIAVYPTHAAAREAYTYKVRRTQRPNHARCAWPWMISCIEVKRSGEQSGWWFPSGDTDKCEGTPPLILPGDKAEAARAQFIKYATEIMLRQHRTHLFAFYVDGPWVRAFRFDRAGCIVSEPFHVVRSRLLFSNLLFRLFCLSPEGQGLDGTVTLATRAEVTRLESVTTDDPHFLEHRSRLLSEQRLYPIYKVECPTVSMKDYASASDTSSQQSFLIGKPISSHYSLTGRCTRGYIAFDLQNGCMVFLKDQWRSVNRLRSELETYKLLHQKGVRCIATPIAGGDIQSQHTKAQVHVAWVPKRVHTRLVLKEVGRPLLEYKNSTELLATITYAFMAHRDAWQRAGVLHRDISIGNIMIDGHTGRGFLNDWDLARYAEDLLGPACEPAGISGTWLYKSALSLRYPLKPPEVADDIESFIHVVLYMAMRFHRHNKSLSLAYKDVAEEAQRRAICADTHKLSEVVSTFFYAEEPGTHGFSKGGWVKYTSARSATVPVKLLPNDDGSPSPLQDFLQKAFDLMKIHYDNIDYSKLEKYDPDNLDDNDARAVVQSVKRHLPDDEPACNPFLFFQKDPEDMSVSEHSGNMPWLASSPTEPVDPKAKAGPLDSHAALKQLLQSIFDDHQLDENTADRFIDQFNGLRMMVATESKNPSGKSKTNTKSGSRPKEKAPTPVLNSSTTEEDSPSPPAPSPRRKPGKRVRISDELDICEPGENGLLDRSLATLPSAVPPPATPPPVRRSARLVRTIEAPRLPAISERKRKRGGPADDGDGEDEDEDKDAAATVVPKAIGAKVTAPAKKAAAPGKTVQRRKQAAKAPKVRAAQKAPPARKPSTPPKAAEAQVRRSSRLARKGADRRARSR